MRTYRPVPDHLRKRPRRYWIPTIARAQRLDNGQWLDIDLPKGGAQQTLDQWLDHNWKPMIKLATITDEHGNEIGYDAMVRQSVAPAATIRPSFRRI